MKRIIFQVTILRSTDEILSIAFGFGFGFDFGIGTGDTFRGRSASVAAKMTSRIEERRQLTSDAGIGSLEVWHQFLGTWMVGVQGRVWNGQPAGAPARAAPVEVGQHVGRAADTAVVFAHAPAEPHPAVPCRPHEYDVVLLRLTRRVKRLPLAVLSTVWKHTAQNRHSRTTSQ